MMQFAQDLARELAEHNRLESEKLMGRRYSLGQAAKRLLVSQSRIKQLCAELGIILPTCGRQPITLSNSQLAQISQRIDRLMEGIPEDDFELTSEMMPVGQPRR